MNTRIIESIKYDFSKKLILLVLIEFCVFIFSGVGFESISNAPFFNIGVDPLYWIFYGLFIPQTILKYKIIAITFNFFIVGLLIYSLKKYNANIIRCVFLFLMIYYVTLTGYIGHRNFQSGFVWVLFPLMFSNEKNRMFAFDLLRYWLLFFYTSSAFFKIFGDGLLNSNHLSSILLSQFAPYYVEHNFSFRTSINQYFGNRLYFSQFLYWGSLLLEIFALIGFFTKKFDKIICLALVTFHIFGWVLLDIAPFGQLSVLAILFYVPFLKKEKQNL